jgi:hypothetical protein
LLHCIRIQDSHCYNTAATVNEACESAFPFLWHNSPTWGWAASLLTFLDHTHGRTPLDEWSAHHRGCYLHSTHKRQTSMPLAGFVPTIPASKWPQMWICLIFWDFLPVFIIYLFIIHSLIRIGDTKLN